MGGEKNIESEHARKYTEPSHAEMVTAKLSCFPPKKGTRERELRRKGEG